MTALSSSYNINNNNLSSTIRRREWMIMNSSKSRTTSTVIMLLLLCFVVIFMKQQTDIVVVVEGFGVTKTSTSFITYRLSTKLSSSISSTAAAIDDSRNAVVPKVGIVHHVTKNAFQNIISTRINRFATTTIEEQERESSPTSSSSTNNDDTTDVQCHPCHTNNVFKLIRGEFQCDASIDVKQRTRFGNNIIQFSSGRLDVKRLNVNLWNFRNNKATKPRYLNQFDLIGQNLIMTQDDLFESNCIKNGLIRLLKRILINRGLTLHDIQIESITILSSGKLSVRAITTPTTYSPSLSFELRTGISTASRGHVVTFPGLELSIGNTGIFVPIFPELTVDLGNHAQMTSISIDPMLKHINLSTKITIIPDHIIQKYNIPNEFQQSAKSFAAMCSIDVSRWLTKIGRFAY